MAFATKCGKCDSIYFELREIEPAGATHKLNAVQCKQCGTPFSAVGFYSEATLILEQNKVLAQHSEKIAAIEARLRNIEVAIKQIAEALRR